MGPGLPLYVESRGKIYTKWVRLTPRELAEDGLSFETSKRMPVEADTRVMLRGIPGLADDAYINGRVVYRKKLGPERYRVGIQFTELVNVSREELALALERTTADRALTSTPAP